MSNIESVLNENRSFPPSEAFRAASRVGDMQSYAAMHKESIEDPEGFFGRIAKELPWIKPFTSVLDWSEKPVAKWFDGGQLNASAICLDQHLEGERRHKTAILWEGEPGDQRSFSYAEAHEQVCRMANVLKSRGVERGDRVAIYMPMIPELAFALLACARIGAIHSVIFGGFSANSIKDRLQDGGCTAVITADGGWRRGKVLKLKDLVDKALLEVQGVHSVFVVKRTLNEIQWDQERDVDLGAAMLEASPECEPEAMESEDTLFLLYTSGSTGQPKGIRHTTAGYMLGAYLSTRYVFDLREEDVYWCTADVGWITGHSYIVYGPMANGATVMMYEGAPNQPHPGRFWELVEKYKVSILYTAPTAIRAFMRWGDEHVTKYDRSSLRLLGTVGEPINPEAWIWYREVVGEARCPIVDTWWQTETGSIMLTPLPGAVATKPGSATVPFFGVDAAIVDESGAELGPDEGGLLAIRKPWPSMLRGIWGDDARYQSTYWSHFDGQYYFPGDGARKDEDGYFWIMGRVDDVLNVSGHRLSTMEVESALVSHKQVVEAAVVARPDELTGEAICAFVTLASGVTGDAALVEVLREHVAEEIGKLARPAMIQFTDALPKTRSGKIMRRLLRDVAAGRELKGDTSTLEDRGVLDRLRGE